VKANTSSTVKGQAVVSRTSVKSTPSILITKRRGVRDACGTFNFPATTRLVEDIMLVRNELTPEVSLENALILRNEFGRSGLPAGNPNEKLRHFRERGNKPSGLWLVCKLGARMSAKYMRGRAFPQHASQILESLDVGKHVVPELFLNGYAVVYAGNKSDLPSDSPFLCP